MQLPLITLLDRMNTRPIGKPRPGRMVKGLGMLVTGTELREDILYIAEGIAPFAGFHEDADIIYTCEPVDIPGALFLPGGSAVAAMNDLLSIWQMFDSYNSKLMEIVYREGNLQKFVLLCSEIMGNAAYIVDSSFKVLAIDDNPILSEISAIWKNLIDYGYLSYNIVAGLRQSRDLQRMEASDHAVLFRSAYFNNDFINYNLHYQNKVMGHFFVVGYYRKITEGDVAYANHLGEMLLPAMELDKEYAASRGRDYENFFIHMLTGTLKDSIQIRNQLEPLGWDYDGRYMLFVMQPRDNDELLVSSLCSRLENIRSCKPLFYEDYIVAVFPIAEDSSADIEIQLEQLVAEDGGTGGLSDEFDGFQRLADHYQQATTALALGGHRQGVLIKYREYALRHLMKTADENMDLNMVCEKAVFRLRDHDKAHGGDLANTLNVYLKNERSIVLTSKELHIHRNTLMYRVNKINTILDIDLDDGAARQRICLSFWALDYLDNKDAEEQQQAAEKLRA